MKDIYQLRQAGREYCQTEGSEHYVNIRAKKGVDAIDIAIANGTFEAAAVFNIVKYALRFEETQSLKDLRKASDYAQVLCGVKLGEMEAKEKVEPKGEKCCNGYCANSFIHTKIDVKDCQNAVINDNRASLMGCKWRKGNNNDSKQTKVNV